MATMHLLASDHSALEMHYKGLLTLRSFVYIYFIRILNDPTSSRGIRNITRLFYNTSLQTEPHTFSKYIDNFIYFPTILPLSPPCLTNVKYLNYS
jgi:hypothetical protein